MSSTKSRAFRDFFCGINTVYLLINTELPKLPLGFFPSSSRRWRSAIAFLKHGFIGSAKQARKRKITGKYSPNNL